MRSRLTQPPVVVVGALAYGALLAFLRGRPSLDEDAGVFLSVAGRLLDGDRLYVDVFDNKDPLFFYTEAAALWIGGWRAPPALDAVWLAVAAVSIAGLVRALGGTRVLAGLAFFAYPLLLTSAWYYAGYSMLAALALTPVVGWLAARGNWLAAGFVIGVGVGFKSNLVLLLAATPSALLAVGWARMSVKAALTRTFAGLGGALGALAAILAIRGELVGYPRMLRENVSYANDVLVDTGRESGLEGHLRVIVSLTPHAWWVLGAFCLGTVLASWTVVRGIRAGARRSFEVVVAAMFLATSAAALLTLASTAAWDHHMQLLAYPETLLLAFLVAVVPTANLAPALRWSALVVLVVFGLWALGGTERSLGSRHPESRWWSDTRSATADAMKRASVTGITSYAHLGGNDEEGAGAFLPRRFALACPRFHQYVFTPRLAAVVRCLEQQRPQLILVTATFRTHADAPREWNPFVRRGRLLLERGYELARLQAGPLGRIEVWARRR